MFGESRLPKFIDCESSIIEKKSINIIICRKEAQKWIKLAEVKDQRVDKGTVCT